VGHVRVDVGPKAILTRLNSIPERARARISKAQTHYRFARLETILPWHCKSEGCTILLRQRLAVDPGGKESQFIRRFLDREPFDVRPGIPCLVLPGGDFRIGERVHLDVPCGRERARKIKERAFTRLGVVVALLLAFAGGIVLNLMPCVLPVLSIKSLRWSRTLTLPRVKHALRASLMAGMPVFVDFTAAWCITCKVNERIAFSDPSIRKAFSDAGVATLRADWTRQDPDITHELEANARAGVPLYLFYPRPKNVGEKRPPVILPQILTTSSILREVLDN